MMLPVSAQPSMARLSVVFSDETFWDGPCVKRVWAQIDALMVAVDGWSPVPGKRVVSLRVIECSETVH